MPQKFKAPEGVAAFSYEGEQFDVKRGVITLPDDAPTQMIIDAVAHGFVSTAVEAQAE
jgi:hypothetical protein